MAKFFGWDDNSEQVVSITHALAETKNDGLRQGFSEGVSASAGAVGKVTCNSLGHEGEIAMCGECSYCVDFIKAASSPVNPYEK